MLQILSSDIPKGVHSAKWRDPRLDLGFGVFDFPGKKDDAIYLEAGFFFKDWYIGDLPQQNIPSIFWSHLNICLFCFLSQALCDMERNAGNKRLCLLYKVSWLEHSW